MDLAQATALRDATVAMIDLSSTSINYCVDGTASLSEISGGGSFTATAPDGTANAAVSIGGVGVSLNYPLATVLSNQSLSYAGHAIFGRLPTNLDDRVSFTEWGASGTGGETQYDGREVTQNRWKWSGRDAAQVAANLSGVVGSVTDPTQWSFVANVIADGAGSENGQTWADGDFVQILNGLADAVVTPGTPGMYQQVTDFEINGDTRSPATTKEMALLWIFSAALVPEQWSWLYNSGNGRTWQDLLDLITSLSGPVTKVTSGVWRNAAATVLAAGGAISGGEAAEYTRLVFAPPAQTQLVADDREITEYIDIGGRIGYGSGSNTGGIDWTLTDAAGLNPQRIQRSQLISQITPTFTKPFNMRDILAGTTQEVQDQMFNLTGSMLVFHPLQQASDDVLMWHWGGVLVYDNAEADGNRANFLNWQPAATMSLFLSTDDLTTEGTYDVRSTAYRSQTRRETEPASGSPLQQPVGQAWCSQMTPTANGTDGDLEVILTLCNYLHGTTDAGDNDVRGHAQAFVARAVLSNGTWTVSTIDLAHAVLVTNLRHNHLCIYVEVPGVGWGIIVSYGDSTNQGLVFIRSKYATPALHFAALEADGTDDEGGLGQWSSTTGNSRGVKHFGPYPSTYLGDPYNALNNNQGWEAPVALHGRIDNTVVDIGGGGAGPFRGTDRGVQPVGHVTRGDYVYFGADESVGPVWRVHVPSLFSGAGVVEAVSSMPQADASFFMQANGADVYFEAQNTRSSGTADLDTNRLYALRGGVVGTVVNAEGRHNLRGNIGDRVQVPNETGTSTISLRGPVRESVPLVADRALENVTTGVTATNDDPADITVTLVSDEEVLALAGAPCPIPGAQVHRVTYEGTTPARDPIDLVGAQVASLGRNTGVCAAFNLLPDRRSFLSGRAWADDGGAEPGFSSKQQLNPTTDVRAWRLNTQVFSGADSANVGGTNVQPTISLRTWDANPSAYAGIDALVAFANIPTTAGQTVPHRLPGPGESIADSTITVTLGDGPNTTKWVQYNELETGRGIYDGLNTAEIELATISDGSNEYVLFANTSGTESIVLKNAGGTTLATITTTDGTTGLRWYEGCRVTTLLARNGATLELWISWDNRPYQKMYTEVGSAWTPTSVEIAPSGVLWHSSLIKDTDITVITAGDAHSASDEAANEMLSSVQVGRLRPLRRSVRALR